MVNVVPVTKQLFHRSHVPLKEVDHVRRLVHDDTAPFGVPAPAPGGEVVIILTAPEFDDTFAEDRVSETPLIDRLPDTSRTRVPAALKNHRKLRSISAAGRDRPVSFPE